MLNITKVIAVGVFLVLVGRYSPVVGAPCTCAQKIANCDASGTVKDKHLVFTSPAAIGGDCVVITYTIDGEQKTVTFKGDKDDSTEYLKSNPKPELKVNDCDICDEASSKP
jgi:hypothetical protein